MFAAPAVAGQLVESHFPGRCDLMREVVESVVVNNHNNDNNIVEKQKPQPTSEQMMIAQILNGSESAHDDPSQRKKIQVIK